jgi:hypothetical protein
MNKAPMKPDEAASADTACIDKLERLMQSICESKPSLSAPALLQSRVLAAIEQRSKQWWRQPMMRWPIWAQALSLLVFIAMAWLMSSSVGRSEATWLAWPNTMITLMAHVFYVLHDLLWLMVTTLPVSWLLLALLSMVSSVLMLWAGTASLFRLADR